MAQSNYYVTRNRDRTGNVLERLTKQRIAERIEYAKALKICKHMSEGGAFAGWTPAFMLVSVKKK